jgi:ribosomal protein S18 acetylase RimI-like enzyme
MLLQADHLIDVSISVCQHGGRDMLTIRPALPNDRDAIWSILEPVIRAGDTYTLPRDLSREDALSYWFSGEYEVFVAQDDDDGAVLGTYHLRANQRGGGSHVANCGYMTASKAAGRGVGSAMCAHSIEHARKRGFRAMQFNFVVSSNHGAVRLWQKHCFRIVGTLPKAFLRPDGSYTDAYVMYREL